MSNQIFTFDRIFEIFVKCTCLLNRSVKMYRSKGCSGLTVAIAHATWQIYYILMIKQNLLVLVFDGKLVLQTNLQTLLIEVWRYENGNETQ